MNHLKQFIRIRRRILLIYGCFWGRTFLIGILGHFLDIENHFIGLFGLKVQLGSLGLQRGCVGVFGFMVGRVDHTQGIRS